MANGSERYIRGDIQFRRRTDGRMDVYLANTKDTIVVAPALVRVLEHCRSARTLAEHAAEIGGEAVSPESVESMLDELVDFGLLRLVPPEPADSTIEGADVTPDCASRATADRIALEIPTAAANGAAARLLESLRESVDLSTFTSITVRLDSDDIAELQTLDREVAHPAIIRDRSDHETRVSELCEILSLSGTDCEAVRFGLIADDTREATTVGTIRNMQLLDAAGKTAVLSIDDDVLSRGARFSSGGTGPHAWPGIATITGRSNSVTLRYAADRQRLLGALDLENINPISEVQGIIGRSVGELASRMQVDWSQVSSRLLARIEAHDPTVDAALFGTIGDSGFGSGHVLFSDAFGFQAESGGVSSTPPAIALTTRELCRYTTTLTLSSSPFCMSTAFALNTGNVLPPFFPFGRGEDGVFGQMLLYLFNDSMIAHLPVSLLHDPIDSGQRKTYGVPERMEIEICRFVSIFVGYYASRQSGRSKGTRAERLEHFGSWLVTLSEQRMSAFGEAIRRIVSAALRRYGDQLRIKLGHLPRESAIDSSALTRLISDIDRLVSNNALPPVTEYRSHREEPDLEPIRLDLLNYGRFLQLWPNLRNAASGLIPG